MEGKKYLKLQKIYLTLVFIFLYAPIVVLILFSFNESKSRASFTGFTFDWYIELFSDRQIMQATMYTVLIALISSVVSTIIGVVTVIGLGTRKSKYRKAILTINNLPILNPDIVTGISLMILFITVFNFLGFGELGFATMLLAHIIFNIPYAILTILPKYQSLDKNLLEAALDLGATRSQAILKVILPELKTAIFSALVLTITLSLDDFIISFFTTGNGVSNISILVYSMARRGINPKINALSTILFAFVIGLLLLNNMLSKKNNKNNKNNKNVIT
ncbi:MAG: ABC transporter permease [Lachnospirales bacterium]